jgi:hypothetical protein
MRLKIILGKDKIARQQRFEGSKKIREKRKAPGPNPGAEDLNQIKEQQRA